MEWRAPPTRHHQGIKAPVAMVRRPPPESLFHKKVLPQEVNPMPWWPSTRNPSAIPGSCLVLDLLKLTRDRDTVTDDDGDDDQQSLVLYNPQYRSGIQ